jgi:hypothetical protein
MVGDLAELVSPQGDALKQEIDWRAQPEEPPVGYGLWGMAGIISFTEGRAQHLRQMPRCEPH